MTMTPEQIKRINELAHKKKEGSDLTSEERKEQATLRRAYIDSVKESLRAQVETTKFVDENGKDITPSKLKKIQKSKGLRD